MAFTKKDDIMQALHAICDGADALFALADLGTITVIRDTSGWARVALSMEDHYALFGASETTEITEIAETPPEAGASN